jgi:hypothetical protein
MRGEEARVASAMAEAEAKADALESYRRARQAQMRADIEEHRQAQARRAAADAAEAARLEAEQQARFRANVGALAAMERRDADERRAREHFLKEYHRAQMADKRRALEGAADADRATAAAAGAAASGKDTESGMSAAFAAAADALVAQEAARGHRTLSLKRAIARSLKDPLIAATQLM